MKRLLRWLGLAVCDRCGCVVRRLDHAPRDCPAMHWQALLDHRNALEQLRLLYEMREERPGCLGNLPERK